MSDSTQQETQPTRSPEEYERLAKLHDSFKPIWLTETIQLGPILPSDEGSLVEYLNDSRVHPWLLGPPYPYTLEDADEWIAGRVDRMSKRGTPLGLVFRDMTTGKDIGAIRVSDASDEDLDGDDVGYWLAPEYHGKGLMTKAIKMVLRRTAIDELGKRKFNAHAFVGNMASRRILEKAGFVLQPGMEKTKLKYGQEIKLWTLRLYLTEEDIANMEVIPEATPHPSLV